jgi:hypothetical protein
LADRNTPRQFTLREWYEKRLASAQAMRKPIETDWQEIERLALPSRSDYLSTSSLRTVGGSFLGSASPTTMKRRANTAKQDTSGRIAGRTLINGMSVGMGNNARPWFGLTPPDEGMMEFQPVKEWLQVVQREIYAFFARTNYYDANKVAYSELGHMGSACNVGVEHPDYGMVWHALEAGEYWLEQDDGLRISAVFREVHLTVDNLVRMFPWSRLTATAQRAYNEGRGGMVVPCIHVIDVNAKRDATYFDVPNKPWRSIWWEVGQTRKEDEFLLKVSGFDSKPFSAPRWETRGAQVWSDRAPAFDALPDLRELELMARRYGRAVDNLTKPAIMVPAGLSQTPISIDPGSINFVNDMQGQVTPVMRPDPNTLPMIERGRDRLERRINQIFYADLWMAITDMEGVQPRNEQELLYRNEEKLTQLGPVVDRVNIEKLEVDVERAYQVLQNLGRIPPPPPELRGVPLGIEFVSILAQAQKAAANTNIERAARFVGFLTGVFPEAALKLDAQQAVDEWALNAGTNPRIIRSDEVVAKMMAEQQAQQQAAQAAQMAPAARDGAQAAQLLSQTQVGPDDTSMLNQLMGV